MAESYPLDLSTFWNHNLMQFVSYTAFHLGRFESAQITGGGKVIGARKGTPLWMGSGTLRPLKIDDAVTMTALFNRLRGIQGSFRAYDRRRPQPKNDPNRTKLAAYTPTLSDINPDNDAIKITGLPASGFFINAGDFISFSMGGTDKTLHQFMEGGETGVTTPYLRVEPNLPTGLSVGTNADFYSPSANFKIVPQSWKEPPNEDLFARGFAFDWIQTLG